MTPDDALARSWAVLKRTGMLKAADLRQQPPGAPSVQADVLLDAPGAIALDDLVASDHIVTYRVADWPAVRADDRVTIGAVQYQVRQTLPIDDGLIARAALRRLN